MPAGNFTFEPRRPRKEEPYKIIGENDPRYLNSWKTTANTRRSSSEGETESYFNNISKNADSFRGKAYKEMNSGKKKKLSKSESAYRSK